MTMSLSIGIVGLPNVGKSTLFNALTCARNAEAANYPFCTIEPNKAAVPVPDPRVAALAALVKPQRAVNAVVEFVDIAGLVRGASKGEGLGNQFLGHIRECAAILHVVRCFDDENVTHVEAGTDPARDVEIIETELLLADTQSVEKRLERITKMAKGDRVAQALRDDVAGLLDFLNEGNPASRFAGPDSDAFRRHFREMGLITAKKMLYCANIDEAALASGGENAHVTALRALAHGRGAGFVGICARIEEELLALEGEDLAGMLRSYDIGESGLASVIRSGYGALGLISFFTAGEKEVRAWTIHDGDTAQQAAGVIHTDFERGFIRAEVISYDDYIALGSESAARAVGHLRTEGREYTVRDGDVIHFLFNV